jgi:hypothetical protein
MTTLSRPILGLTVLGAVLVSGTLSASAMTVGRCNALVDGVYVPVLVVRNGDEETIHQIGSDGLTRRIVFDVDAALTWAAALLGVSDINYSDECHKPGGEDVAAPPPVTVVEEEEEDEDEDDYGGGNDSPAGGDGDGNDTLVVL